MLMDLLRIVGAIGVLTAGISFLVLCRRVRMAWRRYDADRRALSIALFGRDVFRGIE